MLLEKENEPFFYLVGGSNHLKGVKAIPAVKYSDCLAPQPAMLPTDRGMLSSLRAER